MNDYRCFFRFLGCVLRNQDSDITFSAVVLLPYVKRTILALCSVVNVIVKMASWLQRISVLAEKTALNKGIKVKFNAI